MRLFVAIRFSPAVEEALWAAVGGGPAPLPGGRTCT